MLRQLFSSRLAPLLVSAGIACSSPAPHPDVIIDGVTIIDGTGAAPAPDRAVAIRDGQITAIGLSGSLAPGDSTVRVDGRGKFLIPGLWDMHAHAMGLEEHAFPLFLANGVTSIRDMGDNLETSVRMREATRSGRALGPEILIAGPVLDSPFLVKAVEGTVYAGGRAAVADSASAVFWVDSLSRVPVDQIKVHSMTPRAAYFAILARAKQLGIPVGGHIPDSIAPREAIEAGQRTIEHTWKLSLAMSSRGDEIAKWELHAMQQAMDKPGRRGFGPVVMLRAAADDSGLASFDSTRAAEFTAWARDREVWFDPTLAVIQAVYDVPGASDTTELRYMPPSAMLDERLTPPILNPTAAQIEAIQRKYKADTRPIEALIAGGAKFITGTDIPVKPLVPGFSVHHELAALVSAGLTPMQALEAGTRNSAQAAGRGAQVGTIEAGKRADLILLDADPTKDISNTRRIRAVLTKGRLLDRTKLDSLLADAQAFAKADTARRQEQ
ncbi:MAG TPA: amidohydrolase family protein [Gemmatimonadales bacterium]|nr:amidohydrolase family protein [Gemmatimonadales bacterium]